MKYWNKDKRIRQEHWTKVDIAEPSVKEILAMMRAGKNLPIREHIKYWCQHQESTGKFYHYYGSTTWWFEREEDAAWFILNWK